MTERRPSYDPLLLAAVLTLVGFGLVMVYSASAITAQEKLGDSFYFLKRQAVAAGVGLLGMAVAMRLGYRRMARLAYPLLVVAMLLLIAVLIPGLGTVVGGARRWLRVPGISVQPAEVAKVAWVIYLAYSLAKKREKVKHFSIGFVPHLGIAAFLVLLCMLEPDFGSSVALLFLLFVMLFAAGAKLSYLVGMVLGAIPLAYTAIATSPYRMKRITAFLDPWANRQGSGYQVAESLMSIGSGGMTGLGLGDGRQKLFFLPEAHTDFIGAIIGEELGFVGIVLLVLAFVTLVLRGYRAAFRAVDEHSALLAVGLTTFIGASAFANLAVAMGLLPTKGLVLPFISYGGSSLLVCAGAMGIVLSVSRDRAHPASPGGADAGGAGEAQDVEGDRRPTPELAIARGEGTGAGVKAAGMVPSVARASAAVGLRGATS
jgi:cell division protein FtsW